VELVPDLLAQQLEEPGLAHGPNVVARGVSRRGKTVPSGKTRRSGKPAPSAKPATSGLRSAGGSRECPCAREALRRCEPPRPAPGAPGPRARCPPRCACVLPARLEPDERSHAGGPGARAGRAGDLPGG